MNRSGGRGERKSFASSSPLSLHSFVKARQIGRPSNSRNYSQSFQGEKCTLMFPASPKLFNSIQYPHPSVLTRNSPVGFPEYSLDTAKCFIPSLAQRNMLPLYNERQYDTTNYDKIFASVWLSPTSIIMGTKCNKVECFSNIHSFWFWTLKRTQKLKFRQWRLWKSLSAETICLSTVVRLMLCDKRDEQTLQFPICLP